MVSWYCSCRPAASAEHRGAAAQRQEAVNIPREQQEQQGGRRSRCPGCRPRSPRTAASAPRCGGMVVGVVGGRRRRRSAACGENHKHRNAPTAVVFRATINPGWSKLTPDAIFSTCAAARRDFCQPRTDPGSRSPPRGHDDLVTVAAAHVGAVLIVAAAFGGVGFGGGGTKIACSKRFFHGRRGGRYAPPRTHQAPHRVDVRGRTAGKTERGADVRCTFKKNQAATPPATAVAAKVQSRELPASEPVMK